MRAAEELGARVTYIEPGEGSDREAGLRLLAAEGMDIVIGVGFIFTDDILTLAREYPNVRFADVDLAIPTDAAGNALPLPPNLRALKFREEEGRSRGRPRRAGGQEQEGGLRGRHGHRAHPQIRSRLSRGVQHVCPDCEVIVNYAGVTPEAFRNPGRGKEMSLAMYNQGVNVIFHASGSTGLGVFEAARTTGKLAIGVDADQYSEAPIR